MTYKLFNILTQYLAPQHALSRFAGCLAESRWVWLKNRLIRYFINNHDVNVNEALLPDLSDHPNFNSFFTRYLKPELRPIAAAPDALACPADGCMSQLGAIQGETLIQAKGFHFSVQSLLGGSFEQASRFQDGCFATIYLAPKDYHRVHMPFAGTLRETIYIPGQLFSVNQKTASLVPNLFARNERLVCLFDTAIGPMAIVLVGAMLVSSIHTVWGSDTHSKTITHQSYPLPNSSPVTLAKGEELGHFKMGSTVIILFSKKTVAWSNNISENMTVRMGQQLGQTLNGH